MVCMYVCMHVCMDVRYVCMYVHMPCMYGMDWTVMSALKNGWAFGSAPCTNQFKHLNVHIILALFCEADKGPTQYKSIQHCGWWHSLVVLAWVPPFIDYGKLTVTYIPMCVFAQRKLVTCTSNLHLNLHMYVQKRRHDAGRAAYWVKSMITKSLSTIVLPGTHLCVDWWWQEGAMEHVCSKPPTGTCNAK